jgi:hypothetical protein
MMRKALLVLCLLGFAAGPARAAEEWGLPGEKIARFEAKVVDILCELTGDCPPDCGAGKRQLGLLDAKGRLVLPLKNQVPFAGTAWELIDFCGKQVIADGLFSTNRGHTIFALQFVRAAPAGKWRRANRFSSAWAKKNGLPANTPKAERWFENDPAVKDTIAAQGKLGLGTDADKAYFDKNKEK